jgi:hypothetical protein
MCSIIELISGVVKRKKLFGPQATKTLRVFELTRTGWFLARKNFIFAVTTSWSTPEGLFSL